MNRHPEEWEYLPNECTAAYDRFRAWHNLAWNVQGYGNSSTPVAIDTVGGRIPRELWSELLDFVQKNDHVITDLVSQWGFSLAMAVTLHFDEVYPGAKLEPVPLAMVHQVHLPRPLRGEDGRFVRESGRFEDGWRIFSPLTHSEDMRGRRRRFGLDDPLERHRLEY